MLTPPARVDFDDPHMHELALLLMPEAQWRAMHADPDFRVDADGGIVTDDPWIAERERDLRERWRRG